MSDPEIERRGRASAKSGYMPGGAITILGLGSLLSERSSRTTFPALQNFRLVRLKNYRRVFAHTPSIFVARGIADMQRLEMASLSAEPCEGSSFIMTAFEVEDDGTGMEAFREREEEFDLTMVPFCESPEESSPEASTLGMLCKCGTDEGYVRIPDSNPRLHVEPSAAY